MKNQEKIYTVIITDDYSNNSGDPVNSENFKFNNKEEAEKKYYQEIEQEIDENGIDRNIELFEGDEQELLTTQLMQGFCPSKKLPEKGIIVYFTHVTYMNYCYAITDIENIESSGKQYYSDLPYSIDHTNRTHCIIFENIDKLISDFENQRHYVFQKINSGSSKIENFLAEQGAANYIKEDE